jgi:hypothetical protein
LSEYAKETGIDLTKNPFADQLQSCEFVDAISKLLQDRAKAFRVCPDKHRKLINCFDPILQSLDVFSDTVGEALIPVSPAPWIPLYNHTQVPFPPAKAILVGIDILEVCIFFT